MHMLGLSPALILVVLVVPFLAIGHDSLEFSSPTFEWPIRTLAEQYNCSLKLAFKPNCTSFASSDGSGFGNVNRGIDLKKIKNVVPFGDSWT